jgi:hypothetical protein
MRTRTPRQGHLIAVPRRWPERTPSVKPKASCRGDLRRGITTSGPGRGPSADFELTLYGRICGDRPGPAVQPGLVRGKLNVRILKSDRMLEQDKSSDDLAKECLKSLGISFLIDWDVLFFLRQYRLSLANAEHIACCVGYPSAAVGEALDRLESRGVIQRSRTSQGVRLYQFVFPEAHHGPESCLRRLLILAETRTGRLLFIRHLQQHVALHIVKGKSK